MSLNVIQQNFRLSSLCHPTDGATRTARTHLVTRDATEKCVVAYCYVFRYVGVEVRNIYSNDGVAILPIWLENVRCNGSERHIADCSHSKWGKHSCDHSEDVAVSCYCKILSTLFKLTCYNDNQSPRQLPMGEATVERPERALPRLR